MDSLPPLKTCYYCQESFSMTREFFGVVRANPDGFRTRCNSCMSMPKLTAEQRFWRFVEKTDTCWLWLGKTNSNGRGAFKVGDGKSVSAYRFSWALYNGDIPSEMQICHHCDNPLCVRPDHLFIGTSQDNIDDRQAKGRQAKGESSSKSKLTATQVTEVRLLYAENSISLPDLAVEYSVTVSALQRAISGETWAHLGDAFTGLKPNVKLNAERAKEIRALYSSKHATREELREKYGVSKTTICDVINHKRWG